MSSEQKFIPYGRQAMNEADIEAVLNVLRSDFLTQGPKVQEFEEKLAKYCDARYAVACSNGTAALHLAYLAAGLNEGDEVITTPNTFAATTNMLLAVGTKPVFCDIRLDTNNIDETKIESLITDKTRALVPVHFAGQPVDLDEIINIARKHNLLVIEDAAHALGASYKEKKIGSLDTDMTIFSFHPVKPITMAEGGAIVTNNEEYCKKLVALRNHGIHKDEQGKNVMTDLGFNYRITDIQTALGVSQLDRLDEFIKSRRQVVEWYEEELKDVAEIILPQEIENNYSGFHLYIIRTKEQNVMVRQAHHDTKQEFSVRDELMAYLKSKNIGVNFHYPAVYKHPYYQKKGYENINLENAEIYHNSCITLPIYSTLSQEKVKYICDSIKEFYDR